MRPAPHSFELEANGALLRAFGCAHVSDPDDPALAILEEEWDRFVARTAARDRVAMVEGRLRALMPTRARAVLESGGEGGLLTFLAHRDAVAVECPEPAHEALIESQLARFDSADLAHAYRLRGLVLWHRMRPRPPLDEYLATVPLPRLVDSPPTLEELARRHETLFRERLDPEDEPRLRALTDPSGGGIASRIMAEDARVRDGFIATRVERCLRASKSVFLVYGVFHVIALERALEGRLD